LSLFQATAAKSLTSVLRSSIFSSRELQELQESQDTGPAKIMDEILDDYENKAARSGGVRVWLILWKTFRTIEAQAMRSIQSLSICPSDFGVLEVLLHKGPMPINTIAKKVLLTSGSITALVDRLEKRGLVERFDHPTDRRLRLVRLTEPGQDFIKKAFASHEEHMDEAVSSMSTNELTDLIQLLKKLGRSAEARLADSSN